jgi:hypothetical protein
MRIRIRGPATVTRSGKPVVDARTVRALDGAESEDECADYIDSDLAARGIEGGRVRLCHDSKIRRFFVVTEYSAPRKLPASVLRRLVAATRGQWSDGIGEACFDDLAERRSVFIDLTPPVNKITVEQVADPDQPNGARTPNKLALAKAAQAGKIKEVRALLDAGADMEVMLQKHTPLHLAVIYSHVAVAKLLIERGANVNARDPLGWDPLILCGQVDSLRDNFAAEIARTLLEHGARPNGRRGNENYLKRSPLAAAEGKPKLQAVLRKFGATA